MFMKIIIFEKISIADILFNFGVRNKKNKVFYIDASRFAKYLLSGLKLKRVGRFDFKSSDLCEKNGECSLPRIFGEELIALSNEVQENILKDAGFIKKFGNIFDFRKMLYFFRKNAGIELRSTVTFMKAIEYFRCQEPDMCSLPVDFYIQHTPFFSAIKRFAALKYDINLRKSPSLSRQLRYLAGIIRSIFYSAALCLESLRPQKNKERNSPPKIGSAYRYYGIAFDSAQRCDFPWLLNSGIPYENVMIYFDNIQDPVTDTAADKLGKHPSLHYGAKYKPASASKKVKPHKLSLSAAVMICRYTFKALAIGLGEFFALGPDIFYYLDKAQRFINEYAISYDFYRCNNIKIDVDRGYDNPYDIAKQMALRKQGGINVSYQQASWPIPDVIFGTCAEVVFLFGPHYVPVLEKSGIINDVFVFTGFLTDYSFEAVREKSEKIRERLSQNGAKFIIAYFDENSSDDRMHWISNERSRSIYKRILEWVIEDHEIGLICSPKKPATLFSRISGINTLVDSAKATGRCVFMEGGVRTSAHPVEAALASDLSVGSLIGGTTALESFLSGSRTVYLDTERLYSYPEYALGKGAIVFDNIDNLIKAANKYRFEKSDFNEFGNISLISGIISDKDPFRDGKAAKRMGQYLQSMLECFKEGGNAREAVLKANKRYSAEWTEKNIINCVVG